MSLVGFRAQNHPQQKRNPAVDDRGTPWEMFDPLHARFGFTVDACAQTHNAKIMHYWTPEQDGLSQDWSSHRVWCNPPYSDIYPWVEKAHNSEDAELIVMLLPANRTEQKWWQVYVEPFRDCYGDRLGVEFLPGRPRFICVGETGVLPNQRPPFGCCLLIWEGCA